MRLAILVPAAVALALINPAAAGWRQLTLPEAEQLAIAALKSGRRLNFTLTPPPLEPRRGALFDVVWEKPAPDRGRLGTLLVDIDTADVWDPRRCVRISRPSLERFQHQIRRRLGIAAAEIERARAMAQRNGCSNLVDERPSRADFGLYQLTGISANQEKTLYRYTISADDMEFVGFSKVPIKIRPGTEVRFLSTRESMYVIDEDGAIQELHNELYFEQAIPAPKR